MSIMRGERRRAGRGNTHEPFECCGKEAGPYGRPKATLCQECADLIREGKAARARVPQDLVPYAWTSVDYGWPAFYGTGAALDSDVHRRLTTAFWTLVNAVTVPAPGDTPDLDPEHLGEPDRRTGERRPLPWPRILSVKGHSHDSWSWYRLILARPDVQAALDAVHQAILAALSAAWDKGKERGGSALHGLASGEISLTDFEDTLKPEAERRRR
jgi:hypothetical protein